MFTNILIATFSLRKNGGRTPINGMVEPLLEFFLPRCQRLDLIDGAHPGSHTVTTFFETYLAGRLHKRKKLLNSILLYPILKLCNRNATQFFFKIRDFLSVFEVTLKTQKKYDLFIGLESVYTFAAILLKQLGFLKTVVYYVSDYSPRRFANPLLNRWYLWLDRYCCYRADFIWDVSPAIQPARLKAGLKPNRNVSFILVPNALFTQQISVMPLSQIKPYSLVFAGTLGPENGPEIAIKALSTVLQHFPKTTLHIIGGGEGFEKELRLLCQKLKLEKKVTFYGFIPNVQKVSALSKKFMLGLAPYRAFPDSPRWYADATKIRLYLGAGLPTITSQVAPLGQIIKKVGAGLVVNDNPLAFSRAIIKIFADKQRYKKMRQAAIKFARNNTWQNTYQTAINLMIREAG